MKAHDVVIPFPCALDGITKNEDFIESHDKLYNIWTPAYVNDITLDDEEAW